MRKSVVPWAKRPGVYSNPRCCSPKRFIILTSFLLGVFMVFTIIFHPFHHELILTDNSSNTIPEKLPRTLYRTINLRGTEDIKISTPFIEYTDQESRLQANSVSGHQFSPTFHGQDDKLPHSILVQSSSLSSSTLSPITLPTNKPITWPTIQPSKSPITNNSEKKFFLTQKPNVDDIISNIFTNTTTTHASFKSHYKTIEDSISRIHADINVTNIISTSKLSIATNNVSHTITTMIHNISSNIRHSVDQIVNVSNHINTSLFNASIYISHSINSTVHKVLNRSYPMNYLQDNLQNHWNITKLSMPSIPLLNHGSRNISRVSAVSIFSQNHYSRPNITSSTYLTQQVNHNVSSLYRRSRNIYPYQNSSTSYSKQHNNTSNTTSNSTSNSTSAKDMLPDHSLPYRDRDNIVSNPPSHEVYRSNLSTIEHLSSVTNTNLVHHLYSAINNSVPTIAVVVNNTRSVSIPSTSLNDSNVYNTMIASRYNQSTNNVLNTVLFLNNQYAHNITTLHSVNKPYSSLSSPKIILTSHVVNISSHPHPIHNEISALAHNSSSQDMIEPESNLMPIPHNHHYHDSNINTNLSISSNSKLSNIHSHSKSKSNNSSTVNHLHPIHNEISALAHNSSSQDMIEPESNLMPIPHNHHYHDSNINTNLSISSNSKLSNIHSHSKSKSNNSSTVNHPHPVHNEISALAHNSSSQDMIEPESNLMPIPHNHHYHDSNINTNLSISSNSKLSNIHSHSKSKSNNSSTVNHPHPVHNEISALAHNSSSQDMIEPESNLMPIPHNHHYHNNSILT